MRRVALLTLALTLFGSGLVACDGDSSDEAIEPVPGGVLWDHEWAYAGTYVERNDSSTMPFPTDFPLLEKIRYGEGGAPPVGDVLEGAHVVFEIDGRVLVQPVGYEAPEYYGTDYRIIDAQLLRASIRKAIWFKYSYNFDEATRTLLIAPEEEAGGALMGLILDIVERTLFSGALDSAAGRVTEFLFEDPRVKNAIDQFLYDLIHGRLEELPVAAPEDVTAWLIQVLKKTGVVPESTPNRVLESILDPVVEELLPLDREGLSEKLVELLVSSDLALQITPDRVEKVLTFALYRSVLETGQHLSSIDRVEILLEAED